MLVKKVLMGLPVSLERQGQQEPKVVMGFPEHLVLKESKEKRATKVCKDLKAHLEKMGHMEAEDHLDQKEKKGNPEYRDLPDHGVSWDQKDLRVMLGLLDFQETLVNKVFLESKVNLASQVKMEKKETLDHLETQELEEMLDFKAHLASRAYLDRQEGKETLDCLVLKEIEAH